MRPIEAILVPVPILWLAACQAAPDAGRTPATIENTARASATVTAIDQAERFVTLRSEDDEIFTVHVDPSVQNLDAVEAGDRVVVTYVEALAVRMAQTGARAGEVATDVRAAAAAPGERPAGDTVREITATVRIDRVDTTDNTVTFSVPGGGSNTVAVYDAKMRDFVRGLVPGDLVELTYSEGLAIAVEPVSG